MLQFPEIKPYIFKIGPLQVRWYGLMYLVGFVSSYYLVKYQVKKRGLKIAAADIESLYFYCIVGLIVGARLGYVMFYNPAYYLKNPLDIIAVWHGGMSFHGGLIGALIAGYIFTRRKGLGFLLLADLLVPTAPIGLGLGRLGNFINGELYGRPTDVPWAMVFPGGGDVPRHPSQLYEAFFEGFLLFWVLWLLKDKVKRNGTLTGVFLILYGAMRFIIEFFREPDPQIGFVIGLFSMGQVLSFSMIIAGTGLILGVRSKNSQ